MDDITTKELTERLRRRFAAPQWILCEEFEVPILNKQTGFRTGARRIDAMAHALNPNKPCLFGFEIKVSRGDWLSELRDPEKSERFRRHCNAWYVVSPLKGVVKKEELPEGWGWIATHGKSLAIKKRSEWNDHPIHCPNIIAAFLRRSYLGRMDEQGRQYSEAYNKGVESQDWLMKRLKARIAELENIDKAA